MLFDVTFKKVWTIHIERKPEQVSGFAYMTS